MNDRNDVVEFLEKIKADVVTKDKIVVKDKDSSDIKVSDIDEEMKLLLNIFSDVKAKSKNKRLREIFTGVFVTGDDASIFIADMMRMDSPVWRWLIRISALITPILIVITNAKTLW